MTCTTDMTALITALAALFAALAKFVRALRRRR
jgi:hypothetical protein